MLPPLRFTPDLFSTGLPPPKEAHTPAPKLPRTRQMPPAATAPRSVPLLPTTPIEPAAATALPAPPVPFIPGELLPRAIAPAHFAHPKANREVRLQDAIVAYAFTRAKRRSIGFVVGPDGLAVRAPRWTPLQEVDAALQEKARWILRKLQESQQRQNRLESARLEWRDGVTLPYMGQTIGVLLDPTHGFSGRGAQLQPAGENGTLQTLHVGLPRAAAPEQIRDAVQAWLMRQAQANFTERMTLFAPQLGVEWKKLRLSSAGTRWGSASADGSIRLNWRLIHFRQPVIDYVVVHELSHLRVMDHSPSFWNTVASVVPNYQSLRAQLKEDSIPKW
ncbi:MAG: SprT family zinc-dependent metalloprotease [Rhodoferax sp.]|nr:SprT family zinc-dependent metalloprotease [Rhodoferax sp.]